MTDLIAEFPASLNAVIVVLAALRAAILIAADGITDELRERIVTWSNTRTAERFANAHPELNGRVPPPEGFFARLFDCPMWCVGAYTSSAAAGSWLLLGDIAIVVMLPIAVAGAVGLIGPDFDDNDED